MAQAQQRAPEAPAVTAAQANYTAALAALKALRDGSETALKAGDDAKADLKASEIAAAWAAVTMVAEMPEADRNDAADAVGEQIATARGLPKAVRVYRQRFRLACGVFLTQVLDTPADDRAKAFPHSIAAKLDRAAKADAAEHAAEEAERTRRMAHGNEAMLIAAQSLNMSDVNEYLKLYFAGDQPAHAAFNAALDTIGRREAFKATFSTRLARDQIRAWLADFDASDTAEREAEAKASAEELERIKRAA